MDVDELPVIVPIWPILVSQASINKFVLGLGHTELRRRAMGDIVDF